MSKRWIPVLALFLLLAGVAAGRRERVRETLLPIPAPQQTPASGDLLERAREGRATVKLEEIISGGPPPDGIPAIDSPRWISPEKASAEVRVNEPVISLIIKGDARAYPLAIMTWHEIVNDEVGGRPVTVTFCPLCNTAIAFERRVAGEVTSFGTSGFLYKSDLVMYDRTTWSLWSQIEGAAIAGPRAGERLERLVADILPFGAWKEAYPHGKVLSRETGHVRNYGRNPYPGYDQADQPPFLFEGRPDGRLLPKERVVAVEFGGKARAYPYEELTRLRVIQEEVGGQPLVLFWQPGTASALDSRELVAGRDVGATALFVPEEGGRRLAFQWDGSAFRDQETGSQWDLLGRATSGPLKGAQLLPLVKVDSFWFAWAAFRPQTSIFPDR